MPRPTTRFSSPRLALLALRPLTATLSADAPKQITVLDPGPAAAHNGGRGMALEHGGEV